MSEVVSGRDLEPFAGFHDGEHGGNLGSGLLAAQVDPVLGNLGTFTTFTYGLRVPSVSNPPRFKFPLNQFFGALLHLNRLSGGPDSNRRD